jgi:hypothetical protein
MTNAHFSITSNVSGCPKSCIPQNPVCAVFIRLKFASLAFLLKCKIPEPASSPLNIIGQPAPFPVTFKIHPGKGAF